MALQETTLFGKVDKVSMAIERFRSFAELAEANHPNGFYVADSGGKDSSVIKELAKLAGVKFEIVHNHTTIDYPETVYFVRNEKKRWENQGISYTIDYPVDKNGNRISFWGMLPKRVLPTRRIRWCCEIFKEGSGKGRFVVTGVRWAESNTRKNRGTYEISADRKENRVILNNDNDSKRKMTEHCMKQGKVMINPIIDWTDADVWEFIRAYHVPYNPLYDMGYKRVGCVGCPNSNNALELEKMPKYKNLYMQACKRILEEQPQFKEKHGWKNEQEFFNWWVSNRSTVQEIDGQLEFDDYEDKG